MYFSPDCGKFFGTPCILSNSSRQVSVYRGSYDGYVKHKRNNPTCNPWDSQGNKKMQFLFLLLLALTFRSEMKIVASLRLKNERGERLSSHRSDHVTGVWGGLHNLCNVQRIFPHLGVQHVQLCSQPSHPFIPIIIMHFFSICKLFFSLCTNFLVGI